MTTQKMSLERWKIVKATTSCPICNDTGRYTAPAHPLVGSDMKEVRCGCDYPDAHKNGLYPPRIPRQNGEAVSPGRGQATPHRNSDEIKP